MSLPSACSYRGQARVETLLDFRGRITSVVRRLVAQGASLVAEGQDALTLRLILEARTRQRPVGLGARRGRWVCATAQPRTPGRAC